MGLGGALLAHFNRSITPEAIDPMIATFLIWIMLILGGSGNNRGAILGAAVVWIIWSMTEMLADLLPTELAIQAKYVRMFLHGLMLERKRVVEGKSVSVRGVLGGRLVIKKKK